MIVTYAPDVVQLITQPDHAHLARRFMEHCVPLAARPRREAILHAISEHDNGWTEEDAAPTVSRSTGTVVDFVSAPLSVRHAVWPRAIGRLADDRTAAALVAQHAITIYERFRANPEWAAFFAAMEAARATMLHEAGTVQLSGPRVIVTPDPFGSATIPIEITVREVPHRPFQSDADLRDALSTSTTTTRRGWVQGATGP